MAIWSQSGVSFRRRLTATVLAFGFVVPFFAVPAPAQAYAVPPVPVEIPASIFRSIVSSISIGGSTITSAGLSTTAGGVTTTVGGFGEAGAAAAGVGAGTAAAAAVVALFVGYEIGMWRYTGLAPWDAPPSGYSVYVPGGSIPADWCGRPYIVSGTSPNQSLTPVSLPISCSNAWQPSLGYISGSSYPTKASIVHLFQTPRTVSTVPYTADPLASGSIQLATHFFCKGARPVTPQLSSVSYAATNGVSWSSVPLNGAAWPCGSDPSVDLTKDIGFIVTGSTSLPTATTSWYAWGGSLPFTPSDTYRTAATGTYSGKNTPAVVTGGYKPNKLRLQTYCAGYPVDVWESPWFDTYAARPSFPKRTCPSGVLMTKQIFQTVAQDGTVTVLGTYTAPSAFTDPEVMAPYGACVKAIGTDNACLLRLKRVFADGTVTSCDLTPSPCAGWWTDTAAPDKYRCFWGPYKMSLSECEAYRNSYEPSSSTNDTLTEPTTTGTTVPGTDTSAPPAPQPGTDPWPNATVGLGDNCIPSGWQVLNPFAYAKASACVALWAFVPKQLGAQLTSLRADFETHPPGSLIATALAGFVAFGQGWTAQTCDGYLPWDFSPVEGKVLRVPCAPPSSTAWTTVYALMTVFVAAAGLWAVWTFGVGAFASRSER